jgi:hypothetical protein
MTSWYTIRARATGAADERAEISIYDEIGAYGVTAKGFLAELGALPDEVPIDLRLNSPGGSLFDAVAIHNALQRHAGPVTVWIDGALLHKLVDDRTSPFPGRTCPATSVTGMPSAVKRFRAATRTWTSVT